MRRAASPAGFGSRGCNLLSSCGSCANSRRSHRPGDCCSPAFRRSILYSGRVKETVRSANYKVKPRTGAAAVRRPRIQDVAQLAGVSLGSVSAVLNGKSAVSDGTRARVQSAIVKLDYQPNLYASNLARRRTQVLGVVVSDLRIPFFAEAAYALEQEAARYSYRVQLAATNFSPEQQRAAVQQLLAARIAGIAMLTSEQDREASSLIAASGIPSVFLDTGETVPHATNIEVDSRGGMYAAVEHLIGLGHRDLLFVRNSRRESNEPLLSHAARNEGFAAALRSRRLPALNVKVVDIPGPAPEAGEEAIAVAFAIAPAPFTAVICVTDLVAMGVYRGLQARKLRIPTDVSVIGFDNSYFCRFLSPPLTTVDISREALSSMTIGALLRDTATRQGQTHLALRTELVLRESTAKPNSGSRSMRGGVPPFAAKASR